MAISRQVITSILSDGTDMLGTKSLAVKIADESIVSALSSVLQRSDRDEKSTDDDLFGADGPKKPGDTWPIRPEATAKSLEEHGGLTENERRQRKDAAAARGFGAATKI